MLFDALIKKKTQTESQKPCIALFAYFCVDTIFEYRRTLNINPPNYNISGSIYQYKHSFMFEIYFVSILLSIKLYGKIWLTALMV